MHPYPARTLPTSCPKSSVATRTVCAHVRSKSRLFWNPVWGRPSNNITAAQRANTWRRAWICPAHLQTYEMSTSEWKTAHAHVRSHKWKQCTCFCLPRDNQGHPWTRKGQYRASCPANLLPWQGGAVLTAGALAIRDIQWICPSYLKL